MGTPWNQEHSIPPQGSTPSFGHNTEQANPAFPTGDPDNAPWPPSTSGAQDHYAGIWDNSWQVNPHFAIVQGYRPEECLDTHGSLQEYPSSSSGAHNLQPQFSEAVYPQASEPTIPGHDRSWETTQQAVPYNQPKPSSSTTIELDEQTGPSVPVDQEESPLTPEARRKREEKKERDKKRKRIERSDNSQDNARICELLDIPLTPKKTLANRILHAVETLVEERRLDGEVRDRLRRVEAEADVLRTHMVDCKCSQ